MTKSTLVDWRPHCPWCNQLTNISTERELAILNSGQHTDVLNLYACTGCSGPLTIKFHRFAEGDIYVKVFRSDGEPPVMWSCISGVRPPL